MSKVDLKYEGIPFTMYSDGTICLPHSVGETVRDNMRMMGAKILLYENDISRAERKTLSAIASKPDEQNSMPRNTCRPRLYP